MMKREFREANLDSDMTRNKQWNWTSGRVMRLVWLCGAMLAMLAGRGYAQPVNDFFVNAITLTGPSGTVVGNNVAASIEPGEPDHGLGASGPGVFVPWSWGPASAGEGVMDELTGIVSPL